MLRRVLIGLLCVHCVWGALRLPDKAIQRRAEDIDRFRELGPIRYFLQARGQTGHEAIDWILANTEPRSSVLYEGPVQGALEFAAGVLAPRLLVAGPPAESTNAARAGWPLARARLDGEEGVVCLVAGDAGLRVEVR